jgi:hypothetical protein
MMSERELKAQMRLYAIELFVTNLYATHCVAVEPSNPLRILEKRRAALIEGARQLAFPNRDPAESDQLSAEAEIATTRLVEMTRQMLERLSTFS